METHRSANDPGRADNASAAPRTVVGVSGGVDSSVAALLLRDAGEPVAGLFMQNWADDGSGDCRADEDRRDAVAVCGRLGLPIHFRDFSREYWDGVFAHFLAEYASGRTPNPDVLCNREIKFRHFLDAGVQRTGGVVAEGFGGESEAEVMAPGFGLPLVGPDETCQAHVPTGFLAGFAEGGFDQAFVRLQVAGGLVDDEAAVHALFHHQQAAIAHHHGGDGHVGLPETALAIAHGVVDPRRGDAASAHCAGRGRQASTAGRAPRFV